MRETTLAYECLKKPLGEMTAADRDVLARYMDSWYVNNCAPWRDTRYSGWLEERREVDTVVREFMAEFHMLPEGFDEVRDLMLAMADERQMRHRIDKWYFDNCAIGKKDARYRLVDYDSLPDEALDCMMSELDLPAEQRQAAGKELWSAYRDDFEMWCS